MAYCVSHFVHPFCSFFAWLRPVEPLQGPKLDRPQILAISNGATFNDLEQPISSITRLRHYLTLSILETAKDQIKIHQIHPSQRLHLGDQRQATSLLYSVRLLKQKCFETSLERRLIR